VLKQWWKEEGRECPYDETRWVLLAVVGGEGRKGLKRSFKFRLETFFKKHRNLRDESPGTDAK